ncbi:MAG: mechanosensitive ion channel [Desulfovibrionaceae bacterium]|jgi:small-conductance mechanosensitive channel|nr:mechanosensitive ion channel [Desulfovibrionaceae bacterium]
MNAFLDPAVWRARLAGVDAWARALVPHAGRGLVQEALVLVAVLLAGWLFGRALRRRARAALDARLEEGAPFGAPLRVLVRQIAPLALLCAVGVARAVLQDMGASTVLHGAALSLLGAWVLAQLAAAFLADPFARRVAALVIWCAAALHVLHLLGPVLALLDRASLTLGSVRISVLAMGKALVLLLVLLRGSAWLSALFAHSLDRSQRLTPSTRILAEQVVRIVLFAVAILLPITSLGIDLTVFTVFTGAIGVGVGFGLQKVVANLVSGFILLMDRSIKPGDVIQVGEVYGWITDLNARFASVVTRDGMNYLIPNEDLITNQVINWSYSDRRIRLRTPVGVAYGTDVRLAMRLCSEAAAAVGRVLADPAPRCLLRGFGDSSVDLEIRFWIEDPQNGVANVKSEVLLGVWDAFAREGIEIPFPQRDVHVRSVVQGLGVPEPAATSATAAPKSKA